MKIYTDGSSRGNPGPGGFGIVVVDDNDHLLFCHSKMSEGNTTNNEQELLAVLYATLRYGNLDGPPPEVFSDSSYVVNTFTTWMYTWVKNEWKRSNDKVPENLEIIQFYYNLLQCGYEIDLKKIKGHAGNKWNELADKLATGELTPADAINCYGGNND